ncbi:MAG: fumarylacetoacetate hydrolase family protein [Clostridia bacterium]|nr:fumarylacetoacetate hydrolase family protein [Clostridia bacterium]
MRFATYETAAGLRPALVVGDALIPLPSRYPSLLAFIAQGEPALAEARRIVAAYRSGDDLRGFEAGPALPLAEARLRAPIPEPRRNVFCVGRNYREHIEEGDRAFGREGVSEACIFFTKATGSVVGPGAPITGHGLTDELDYECELAVVIGRGGRDIPRAQAFEHIFGYTIVNDVTARDLQRSHRQWFKGKSLDGFCPLGPWIVTKDELPWPLALDMRLLVNGEVRQRLNTRDMLWDVPAIIESLSAGLTLEPGDVIATGTGPGCGFAYEPPRFLRPGDVVRAEIDGIGWLENPVA